MSQPIDLSHPNRTLHVGVILLNSITEILDVAPIDMLQSLSKEFIEPMPEYCIDASLKSQTLDIQFHWVTETGKTPARLTSGISLNPTDSFETCPPLDVVLMGAHFLGYEPSEGELAFIRKSYDDCAAFLTICGGLEGPLKAGLLAGKTATAPAPMLPLVRQLAPGTTWVERRWARDGKLWTSGTLLNGCDLMTAFVTEYWGGPGTLMDHMVKMGGWPKRSAEFKDDE